LVQNHSAWDGPYTSATTSFAAPLSSGQLCLVGIGTGFIASIDRIVLE
jgi:hypothetical protein